MKEEGGTIQVATQRNAGNVCTRVVCTLWNVYYFRAVSLCQTINEN